MRDYDEIIEKLKQTLKEPTTKEKARENLQSIGILDDQGNITEPYKEIFVFKTPEERTITVTLTEKEFHHLQNDLISYIWGLEEKGLDKDDTFGYFSRVKLKEKMKHWEAEYLPQANCQG